MKIIGIIGDPVHHSLSPAMQGAALEKLKLPCVYLPFHVQPADLKNFVRWARESRIEGFNVTLPHKEAILPLLDGISAEARRIGAVNTVVRKGTRWVGHNTDARGYLASLHEACAFSPRGKVVGILGSGGAARSIAAACRQAGASKIVLFNRTLSRAKALARALGKSSHHPIEAEPWTKDAMARRFPFLDLLVNATALGLDGERFPDIPLKDLSSCAIVSDLIYRPRRTELLKAAAKQGLRTHEGWGMLLHQGALSFELWTGRKAPMAVMKRALLDALG